MFESSTKPLVFFWSLANRYRVVMLGEASVGKTALVSQFMTSEYMHTYDASLGESLNQSKCNQEHTLCGRM